MVSHLRLRMSNVRVCPKWYQKSSIRSKTPRRGETRCIRAAYRHQVRQLTFRPLPDQRIVKDSLNLFCWWDAYNGQRQGLPSWYIHTTRSDYATKESIFYLLLNMTGNTIEGSGHTGHWEYIRCPSRHVHRIIFIRWNLIPFPSLPFLNSSI